MAAVLVIGPIFEVDLLPQQHGFRPGLDAEMALRVCWHVTQHGRREVRSREAYGLRPLQID
jgi:RNA-directed DNA polymerase